MTYEEFKKIKRNSRVLVPYNVNGTNSNVVTPLFHSECVIIDKVEPVNAMEPNGSFILQPVAGIGRFLISAENVKVSKSKTSWLDFFLYVIIPLGGLITILVVKYLQN